MMQELLTFASLGIGHILGAGGADHLLFLLVLAGGFAISDWRAVVGVVSAFTLGHSLTLALAVTGALRLPEPTIEFLIPLTIVAAAVDTVVSRGDRSASHWRRPLLAAGFGLVHGAGFANYLRSLFSDSIAVPLVGFNLGIEIAQVLVLVACGAVFAGLDALLRAGRTPAPARARAIGFSVCAGTAAAVMAAGRLP